MHKNILSAEQLTFLPFLKNFSKDFGLAGGTAIALHLGHRRSLDFDLFSAKEFNNSAIQRKILNYTPALPVELVKFTGFALSIFPLVQKFPLLG